MKTKRETSFSYLLDSRNITDEPKDWVVIGWYGTQRAALATVLLPEHPSYGIGETIHISESEDPEGIHGDQINIIKTDKQHADYNKEQGYPPANRISLVTVWEYRIRMIKRTITYTD